MFFGFTKKRREELIQTVDGMRREAASQSESLRRWFENCMAESEQKQGRETEILNARVDELLKSQKRQAQSLEDFLDEEQERLASSDNMREEIRRDREREAALLSLICCYQEQMHLLRRQVLSELEDSEDKKIAWENQFEIVAECINRQMRACAMDETGKEREPVDFAIHEVLSVSDTEDRRLEGRVEKVFSPGCVYCGKTVKKAKVAAYRRTEDENDNRD